MSGGVTNTITNTGILRTGVGGTAIKITGGANNTINNYGLIATGSVLDMAIRTDVVGNLVINNYAGGVLIGSIDPGTITRNNAYGATYMSGSEINLGPAINPLNTFYNDRLFSPGGVNTTMSPALLQTGGVTLTGNYVQSSTGNYLVDFQFVPNNAGVAKGNLADQVYVTGTASLAGLVTINDIASSRGLQPGNHSTLIMYAAGGLTSSAVLNSVMYVNGVLAPSTTAVFTPSLSTTPLDDPTLVQVYPGVPTYGLYFNYSVNYDPVGLTPNQNNVGGAVNLIQNYGAPAYQAVV